MCGKSCELTEEKLPNVVQRAGDEVRRWSRCRSRSRSCGDIKGSVCCILRENTHNTHDKDNKRQLRFHCYAKCLHEFPLQFPNAQIARSWALSCFQCRMICPTRHLLRRILFAGLINWTCEREHAERNKKSLWANVTFFVVQPHARNSLRRQQLELNWATFLATDLWLARAWGERARAGQVNKLRDFFLQQQLAKFTGKWRWREESVDDVSCRSALVTHRMSDDLAARPLDYGLQCVYFHCRMS